LFCCHACQKWIYAPLIGIAARRKILEPTSIHHRQESPPQARFQLSGKLQRDHMLAQLVTQEGPHARSHAAGIDHDFFRLPERRQTQQARVKRAVPFALPDLSVDHSINWLPYQVFSQQREVQLHHRHRGQIPVGVFQRCVRSTLAQGFIFASQVDQQGIALTRQWGLERSMRALHQTEPAGSE